METVKKYWWAFALGLLAIIYFLFKSKKGKNVRKRVKKSYSNRRNVMRMRYQMADGGRFRKTYRAIRGYKRRKR